MTKRRWDYRLVRHKDPASWHSDGEHVLAVHEVIYESEKIIKCSPKPIDIKAATVEDLRILTTWIITAFSKPILEAEEMEKLDE